MVGAITFKDVLFMSRQIGLRKFSWVQTVDSFSEYFWLIVRQIVCRWREFEMISWQYL